MSDMVAKGIVQLSTGPQKCVLKVGEKRRKIKWLLFHKLFTHVCIYIYINEGVVFVHDRNDDISRRRRGREDETKNGIRRRKF